ncbi:protein CHUP1, chloroplastic-like [Andrographis paniculata]|uniref:protein CHUP1, chloroplastic-like n=1 Tax=Andrographis paniculata TaxID=175694 RepID=UPI0021E94564|nr:protein CHUP1, chloroplastic-like [Andrographis paniculata]XP_051125686.1 protein CHUP1, chloroplastic-like [Andrographis paniculata]
MREEISSESRVKPAKYADQNQAAKENIHSSVKVSSNFSRMKSSWGSHIVKGFSAADRKTKTRVLQNTAHVVKKPPITNSDAAAHQKNQTTVSNSRTKRSLIGDLACSINAAQVHPQAVQSHNKTKSINSSQDLFQEIDHLRSLLQESKDRELKLQAELSECKRNPKVLELEKDLELKKSEIDGLLKRVESLESEKANLSGQVVSLAAVMGKQDEALESDAFANADMEVVELRRLNKELQLQKRNLACRISSLESQLTTLAKFSESDSVEKIKAEASMLRDTNQDLCKQVEGLQMSRMNEVEELAYLRWVNSCLRDELRSCSTMNPDPDSVEKSRESISFSPFNNEEEHNDTARKRLFLVKKFKKWPITDEDLQQMKYTDTLLNRNWDDPHSTSRRHSISGANCCPEELATYRKRQSDSFVCSKEAEKRVEVLVSEKYDLEVSNRSLVYSNCQEVCRLTGSLDVVEKRALRIPNPPPRPSCTGLSVLKEETSVQTVPPAPALPPPPPPPPPPPKLTARRSTGVVQRAPQVVEFYHSLMKRESRKDSLNPGATDTSDVANVHSSMIGEIENRSSHLLAIKMDVEIQGEFVNSLIREVNNAVYQDIEDVVAFVKWLDDELCFLVDERAVLKHFAWPEKKSDTLREAAFGYRDVKKLEQEISNYTDDPCLQSDVALKKMAALSERMERTVHDILRARDALMRNCKEFNIPTDWMLDMGILSKIKFGSVKLAKMYMKRVAMELQSKGTSDKDSSLDYMLLQGVRFAFRIHQFAGGFDAETMHAFEELRDLAMALNKSRD